MTYWIAAEGGGTRLEGGTVQVVTPRSPFGRAVIGKVVGDDCDVVIAGRTRSIHLVAVT